MEPIEIKLEPTPLPPGAQVQQRSRLILFGIILVLAAIFLVGLRWAFTVLPEQAPFLLFSYAVGLTMIFLPCTLPLAFVIVPLSMGKSYQKGIGIALAFSLGVAITLSIYGALIGLLGDALGIGRVETAKNILYALAGLLGIFFALGEIGLIKYRMPAYSGAGPGFMQRQQDFIKAFLLGLFLGNVGVGCPNPLFNAVILPQIVVEASVLNGFWIMFIHALGRVTPLLLLAFLAILGINATGFLVRHREKVEKATGWGMVFVGGFLVLIGIFGHDGYVYSGIHSFFEKITQEEAITNILGEKIKTLGHGHITPQGKYLAYGPWVMVFLWIMPMWWWLIRKRSQLRDLSLEEEARRRPYIKAKTWFIISLSLLLLLSFGWALPHNFIFHTAHEEMHEELPAISVTIERPTVMEPSKPATFFFVLKDGDGKPLTGLEYSHERLLHTIIISEDFTKFWHLHPEDQVVLTNEILSSGRFPLTHTFPQAGRYLIALDFKHQDHELQHFEILSIGRSSKTVTITKDTSRVLAFDGYKITLTPDKQEIFFKEPVIFTYHFEKNGSSITDLEPYLAAPMHFAIVSLELSSFTHTHGVLKKNHAAQTWSIIPEARANGTHKEKTEDSRKINPLPTAFGPEVYLQHTFPHPGLYVIFGEFKHKGQVIVTQFMVEVGIGKSKTTSIPHGHE